MADSFERHRLQQAQDIEPSTTRVKLGAGRGCRLWNLARSGWSGVSGLSYVTAAPAPNTLWIVLMHQLVWCLWCLSPAPHHRPTPCAVPAADVLQLQPLPPDLQDALDTPFGGTEGILTARAALMRDFEVGFSFENYPSGLRAPTIPDEDKVSTCVGAMGPPALCAACPRGLGFGSHWGLHSGYTRASGVSRPPRKPQTPLRSATSCTPPTHIHLPTLHFGIKSLPLVATQLGCAGLGHVARSSNDTDLVVVGSLFWLGPRDP